MFLRWLFLKKPNIAKLVDMNFLADNNVKNRQSIGFAKIQA